MQKVIPPYCYIELPGATYILNTQPPFLVGRVWMFKTQGEIENLLRYGQPTAKIENYSICITKWHEFRLDKKEPPDIIIKETLEGMLTFFKETRFNKSAKFYERFKN